MDLTGFPKLNLGFFPTPLVELKALSKALSGPRLFMKRDDLTGLAFGGNKTRKLEFLIGEAAAGGCDTVITGGAEQSNHCRQTAAAAAACGLECHLVLGGEAPSKPNGNLLLDMLFNARIHWTGPFRRGEKIPDIFEDLRSKGKKPYIIPYGGSNATGAMGFVNAVQELANQAAELNTSFTHLIFASSSGGTQSGLMVGARLFNQHHRILGVGIDKGEPGDPPLLEQIPDLANQIALRLSTAAEFTTDDVTLLNDYLGDGYGVAGEPEKEAISLTAELEGILLDPVYTGRAMGGLIDLIRKKEFSSGDRVLFWHTGGGPALFSYSEELANR